MGNKLIESLDYNFNLQQLGKREAYVGDYQGFKFTITVLKENTTICMPVKLNETYNDMKLLYFLDNFTSDLNAKVNASYNGNNILVTYVPKIKQSTNIDNLDSIIMSLVNELSLNKVVTCCAVCGEAITASPFVYDDSLILSCQGCIEGVKTELAYKQEQAKEEPYNLGLGIVGAVIGGILGTIGWALIGQKYYGFIAGFLLALCTVYGYKLCKGRFNKTGAVIVSILLISFALIAGYLTIALSAYNYFGDLYDVTFFDCLKEVPYFLSFSEIRNEFLKDVILGLAACGIGGGSMIIKMYKEDHYLVDVEEIEC